MKFTVELSEEEEAMLEGLYVDLGEENESMDHFFGRMIEEWLLAPLIQEKKKEEENKVKTPYSFTIEGGTISDNKTWVTTGQGWTWGYGETWTGTGTGSGYITGGKGLPFKTGFDELKEKEDEIKNRDFAIGWYAPADSVKDPAGWRAPTNSELDQWHRDREVFQRMYEWTGKKRQHDGHEWVEGVRLYHKKTPAFGEWRPPTSAEVMDYEMKGATKFRENYEIRTGGTGVLLEVRGIKGK